MTTRHRILTFQSAYYILTGLWPLVHFASFELVTGPKTDDWLVRMVGLLVVLIGVTLAVAEARCHSEVGDLRAGYRSHPRLLLH